MKLNFVTSNDHKINEINYILQGYGIELIQVKDLSIKEIQSISIKDIVQDKTLKAFEKIMRPLIVEHTGMYIEAFGDLPGGLTQIFWESLGEIKIADLFSVLGDGKTKCVTTIGFCDGKIIKQFTDEISGKIISSPIGEGDFDWDTVFQTDGFEKTFAQMEFEEKCSISMRTKAIMKFIDYLKNEGTKNE